MFESHVNSLGDDSLSDLFVDDDSDGARIDVEDSACASVVELIGHAFVDGSVNDNVDDVTDFEGGESFADVDGTVLLEAFSEFVSGFSSLTVAVSHGK